MTQQNDVIAIIIIVLFVVLALIAFGIYHLVSVARRGGSSSGSGSDSRGSLVDD
jgi:thiol:disulfide interchange protein